MTLQTPLPGTPPRSTFRPELECGGGWVPDLTVRVPLPSPRQLDRRAVFRSAGGAIRVGVPGQVDVLTDVSASMTGGNDATGLRHEATLIGAEFLARSAKLDRRPAWSMQVRSFDLVSRLETEVTSLDRAGVRLLAGRLLVPIEGGSSCLGPSLHHVEAAPLPPGPRALVVHSDFCLYDDDVPGVLTALINSSADAVTAIVYSATPPAQLADTRVNVVGIDPRSDPPEKVAHIVIDTARAAAAAWQTNRAWRPS